MKVRNKVVYGIAGLIAFLPLSILVVIQSIFALEASYDSKLVIDANKITVTEFMIFDSYNEPITNLFTTVGEDGQPLLFSIIEATNEYLIVNFHGGEVANTEIQISSVQFRLSDSTKTELLEDIVYLRFKNVAMTTDDINYVRDTWLRAYISDMNLLYKEFYEQPAGTIPYIWVKIITASLGTLLGIVTVGFVILRKSTKALVKRYWRIAVLVALIEGTIILGLIAWIVSDMFQVFAAAAIGWLLFLGAEKIAKIKGYLDTASATGELPEVLPAQTIAAVQTDIEALLNKYRK